jgi:hypothetical protein
VDPPKAAKVEKSAIRQTDRATAQALRTLRELMDARGEGVSGRFSTAYLEGLEFARSTPADVLLGLLKKWHKKAEHIAAGRTTSLGENVHRLKTLLDLNETEELVLYFQLARRAPSFRFLLDGLTAHSPASILPFILGTSPGATSDALSDKSTLVRSGLLIVHERPQAIEQLSEYFTSTMCEPATSDEEFSRRFVHQKDLEPSSRSLARFDQRDEETLVRLMRAPLPKEGAHVLVHAARTIDATELVARLFSHSLTPVFVVNTTDVPISDIPLWVYVAQRYAEGHHPGTILVVERAETALTTRRSSMLEMFGFSELLGDVSDKASDAGLAGFPGRCIWITDRPRSLTEKVLARFVMHCEARPGSRGDRRARVAAALSEAGLDPQVESQLAKYSLLSEQTVRQALRLADIIGKPDEPGDRRLVIVRAVEQSQRVLGREGVEDLRDSVTAYDLGLLNLKSRFTPEQVVEALRQHRSGTLLFHGIPGAGKTQFAEYLAVELDMPLIMKRASDILSKWVGESESNIAEAFAEAEAEGAILFIDEADSFLRDRTLARAEWSVTQVNEFLQHLERSRGVVVCATNLMDDIDSAAMRRFTFKIEFLPLRPDQAWQMFCTEVGIKEEDESTTQLWRARLTKISDLAPGDFATCKRMASLLTGTPMTPDEWLEQLESEAKTKMHGLRRMNLGYGSR